MTVTASSAPRTGVQKPKQPELFSDEWFQLTADAAWREQRRRIVQSQNVWNRLSNWSLPVCLCLFVLAWLFSSAADEVVPPWDDVTCVMLLSLLMLSIRLEYLARLECRLLTAIDQLSQGSRELSVELRFPAEWLTRAREPDLRQKRLEELWERANRFWRLHVWLWRCSMVVLLAVLARWIFVDFDSVFLAHIGWIFIIVHGVLVLSALPGWRIAAERTLLMSMNRFEAEGVFPRSQTLKRAEDWKEGL